MYPKVRNQLWGTFHLRHSHVTYLLANDVPLYAISKRLGHSNTTITANKYAYLIDEFKARSDNKIEQSLDKIESPKSQSDDQTKKKPLKSRLLGQI